MKAHPFRKFREEHRLTGRELADALGVKAAALSHYETRRRALPVEVARKFQKYARTKGNRYTLDEIYGEAA